jgi:hypothetical protein
MIQDLIILTTFRISTYWNDNWYYAFDNFTVTLLIVDQRVVFVFFSRMFRLLYYFSEIYKDWRWSYFSDCYTILRKSRCRHYYYIIIIVHNGWFQSTVIDSTILHIFQYIPWDIMYIYMCVCRCAILCATRIFDQRLYVSDCYILIVVV